MAGTLLLLAALAAPPPAPKPGDVPYPGPYEEVIKALGKVAYPTPGDISPARYPGPYRPMGVIYWKSIWLYKELERETEKVGMRLNKAMVDRVDLATKLAIANQLVREVDEACRQARDLEIAYEKAYQAAPDTEQRDFERNLFSPWPPRIYQYRATARYVRYNAVIGHRWPGKDGCVNYRCYQMLTILCGRQDEEQFGKRIAAIEVFVTDVCRDIAARQREKDPTKAGRSN